MPRFTLSSIALFSIVTGSPALTTGCASGAPEAHAGSREHAIVVVGVGKVHAKPDVARIQIGVETRAATVEAANRQNTEQMTRLLGALKGAKIAENDLRTSNYSIDFERNDPGPMAVPTPAPSATAAPGGKKAAAVSAPAAVAAAPAGNYRVSNSVQATVRDLSRVGAVLDTAVATGANTVWGVTFELENDSAVGQQMRERAVADAAERAASLAKLGHVELGEILSISEVVGGGRGIVTQMATFDKRGTPVESGALTFEGQIEIVYALKH